MTINFGSIKKYNTERGFGFVSQTIHNINRPTRQAFFHITTVNSRYPDLAQQIQIENASYRDISFWYEVQSTQKGESVSKLWLSANDIPPSQDLDILTEQIEGIWIDIDTSTPDWLNQVTLDLVGQTRMDELNKERERLQSERKEAEEQERKKKQADRMADIAQKFRLGLEAESQARKEKEAERIEAMQQERLAIEAELQAVRESRVSEIQKICEEYQIELLVHFTHINNLHSILQHGLRGRPQIESMVGSQTRHYNDSLRLDGYPQAICLSISFPNYKMFYKCRCDNSPNSNWVILFLKPSILWELDCKFYQGNAASNKAKATAGKTSDALRQMFSRDIQPQYLEIPIQFTTDPQAEVLVFDSIPPHYIGYVLFDNPQIKTQWTSLYPEQYSQEFHSNYNHWFSRRQDYQIW